MATMTLTDAPRKRARKSRAMTEFSGGSGAVTTALPMTVPITQGAIMPASPGLAGQDTGWRYVIRNMQAIVITLAVCLTAIICVWITSSRTPATAAPRFQTSDFDDEAGKTLLKFDRESGRAWRLDK